MKTANELRTGIFAASAMLLRGADWQPPPVAKAEEAVLLKGGPGSGPHPGGGKGGGSKSPTPASHAAYDATTTANKADAALKGGGKTYAKYRDAIKAHRAAASLHATARDEPGRHKEATDRHETYRAAHEASAKAHERAVLIASEGST